MISMKVDFAAKICRVTCLGHEKIVELPNLDFLNNNKIKSRRIQPKIGELFQRNRNAVVAGFILTRIQFASLSG